MTKLITKDKINFNDWHWGEFGLSDFFVNQKKLDKLISKRVSEVLREELKKDHPYVVIGLRAPIRIVVKWPFSDDVFFEAPLRDLVKEWVETRRPGGRWEPIDLAEVKPMTNALRGLLSDIELWCAEGTEQKCLEAPSGVHIWQDMRSPDEPDRKSACMFCGAEHP
jgi:hypothetical protein